jgi:uridylate kinase
MIPGKDDAGYLKGLAGMFRELSKKMQIVVVCGGGRIARYYTEVGRELGAGVRERDLLGIDVTRTNARLLATALGGTAVQSIPLTAAEAASLSGPGRIVVMGGTEPGHTTDAVSSMVAAEMRADRVVNATSVDAVYSDDPRKVPDAERYSRLTIRELQDIVYSDHDAGRSSVFDPLGIKILMKERIRLSIVDGRDLKELENAILGKKIRGTVIEPV